MRPAAKVTGFAAVLAAVFGVATIAGGAVGPVHDRPVAASGHEDDAMGAMGGDGAVQQVRGLAVSDAGLTLELARTTATAGRRAQLRFRIADRGGRTVRDFDIEHTRRMHLIVVRRDMTGFQHLHPRQAADGSWSVPVTLRDAGAYRVFADFSTGGTPRTLASDLTVDGAVRSRPLPAPAPSAAVDGMRVTLRQGARGTGSESRLAFTVARGGRPVAVQRYLGAKGHLVALREGDLAFLHVHPDERRLDFMAEFPSAGRYRLFLQFKTEGRVHTAAFTEEVSR